MQYLTKLCNLSYRPYKRRRRYNFRANLLKATILLGNTRREMRGIMEIASPAQLRLALLSFVQFVLTISILSWIILNLLFIIKGVVDTLSCFVNITDVFGD